MSKSKSPPQPPPQQARPPWLITVLIAGVVLAVIAIIAVITGNQPTVEPEVEGAPRAEVDQTVVDHGPVRINQMVESVFTIRNVGDQPLVILGEPRVELLQGC